MAMTLGTGCQFYFDIDDGNGDGDWVSDPPGPDAAPYPYPDAGPYPYPDASPNTDGGCYDQPWVPEQSLRNPYTGQCEYFGGYYPCGPIAPLPPWGLCESECNAFAGDEAACTSTPGCRAIYTEDRFSGRNEQIFVDCWATGSDWAPIDVACEALDPDMCSMRDDCSAQYSSFECYEDVTGRRQCIYEWFDRCLPEVLADECSVLTSESECLAQGSCRPMYEGSSCTCNGSDCTCDTWVFKRCEAL